MMKVQMAQKNSPLHVVVAGQGRPLVLLHGWGMNSAVWDVLLPHLVGHFRVYCVDLPGHGRSGMPQGDQGLSAWAGAVAQLVPVDAAWVGWSLGGMVAMQAGIMGRATKVVALAASPRFVQGDGWACAMPAETLLGFARALDEDVAATHRRFLGLQVRGVAGARDLLRRLSSSVETAGLPQPDALRLGLAMLAEVDLRAALSASPVRPHFLFGERDQLVPQCAAGALRQSGLAASVEVLGGAGHAPFVSHPASVADFLLRVSQ